MVWRKRQELNFRLVKENPMLSTGRILAFLHIDQTPTYLLVLAKLKSSHEIILSFCVCPSLTKAAISLFLMCEMSSCYLARIPVM